MLEKLLERIKNNVGKNSEPERHPQYTPLIEAIEKYIKKETRYIYSHNRLPFKDCEAYQTLKSLPANQKIEALIFLSERANYLQPKNSRYSNYKDDADYHIVCNLLDAIMRTKFEFPEDFSFWLLYKSFYYNSGKPVKNLFVYQRPFGGFATQIEKHAKIHGVSKQLVQDIETILAEPEIEEYQGGKSQSYWGADIGKAVNKIQQLLFTSDDGQTTVPPFQFGEGKCGKMIKQDIDSLPTDQQDHWNQLFHHLSTATSGKPTKKFISICNPLVDAIGKAAYKALVNQWFSNIANFAVDTSTHTSSYNGREYNYESHEYIESYSFNFLKGLLWSMSRFHDKQSLQTIAQLTEKCFQKIPGVGPAAAGVGNAGIYTLAQSKGLAGISHLSRLKLRIKQNNTQKLIQKYIDEQAAKQGIKPAQIEEIAASDYGLVNGVLSTEFDDYKLILELTKVGATSLVWQKPDGTPQKSVPAFVKNKTKLSDKLKKIRELAKQIKQASTSQRDRIDRLFTENMSWNKVDFEKYYINHGLISQIARELIWSLDSQPAIFIDGTWQDKNSKELTLDEKTKIHLWHPIESEANDVLAWRNKLEELEIQQPIKQAYREIYLLTDAEITTRIYSNRMAAHILKQHQFNSLAALRGWKYSLLGAYDDGRDGDIATKFLPESKLTAQFWIDEILDDTDSFNDAGIWYYVATDQVRFCDANDQPVPLVEVPPLILSEIMRDVDLFVGVASVGNDPQWRDGGPEGRQDYRDYWQSYSFGNLSEVAKTRKSVLEKLLPRLKIRDVAVIDGKFLVVQGKKNKYKIHIGSSNILIAPNDRYLCIVPGRGKDKNVDQIFLPFEGDNGLSIVLSKAFMLADDDKIKDQTILSQL